VAPKGAFKIGDFSQSHPSLHLELSMWSSLGLFHSRHREATFVIAGASQHGDEGRGPNPW
jgi:hypothetical protein